MRMKSSVLSKYVLEQERMLMTRERKSWEPKKGVWQLHKKLCKDKSGLHYF
jgi:hypothetical protein